MQFVANAWAGEFNARAPPKPRVEKKRADGAQQPRRGAASPYYCAPRPGPQPKGAGVLERFLRANVLEGLAKNRAAGDAQRGEGGGARVVH